MKRVFYSIIIGSAALLTACNAEPAIDINDAVQRVDITANISGEPTTKALFEQSALGEAIRISWVESDQISIHAKADGEKASVLTTSDEGESASFSGSAALTSGSSYLLVHPACQGSINDELRVLNTDLVQDESNPLLAIQQGATFSSEEFVYNGETALELNLEMKHDYAYIELTIPEPTTQKGDIAENYKAQYGNPELITLYSVAGDSESKLGSVDVSALTSAASWSADGKGSDITAYFIIPEVEATLKWVISTSEGVELSRSLTGAVNCVRGGVHIFNYNNQSSTQWSVATQEPVATATNNDELKVTWTSVKGATSYQLIVKDDSGNELSQINVSSSEALEYDFAANGQTVFADYVGLFSVAVEATTGETSVMSNEVSMHTHFSNTSGNGTSDGAAFDIAYARHLSNISKFLGAENSALYFKQSADINLQGVAFEPISSGMDNETNTYQGEFCGSYNGAGFKISNWEKENNLCTNVALFSQIGATGLVKGVNLEGVNLLGGTYLGGISARNSGTIENCTVSGVIKSQPQEGVDSYCGGMAAIMYGGVIKGCSNSATISSTQKMVAGIVGEVQMINTTDTFRIEDCHNSGNITSATEVAGGIVGRSLNKYKAGSVTEASDVALEIIGCSNSAEIVTKIPYTAGIIGNSNLPTKVSQCYNTGDIKTKDSVLTTMNILGGIVGSATNAPVKLIIENCYNVGSVTAATTKANMSIAGGIIGRSLANSLTITSCHNVGVTSSPLNLNSGILGYTTKADKIAMGANYSTDAEGVMQKPTYDDKVKLVEGCLSLYNNVTAEAMADQATFAGWDFSSLWIMDSSKGYPTLK